MISAVVWNDVASLTHNRTKCTITRLNNHYTGVKYPDIISCSWHLRKMEEKIKIKQDDNVCINEHHFVIIRQLPQSKLAIIVFIVWIFFCKWVSDSCDPTKFPSCGCESSEFGNGDRVVVEKDEITFCVCLKKALS